MGWFAAKQDREVPALTAATLLHLPARDAHPLVQSSLVMKLRLQCTDNRRELGLAVQRQFRGPGVWTRLQLGCTCDGALVHHRSPNVNVKGGSQVNHRRLTVMLTALAVPDLRSMHTLTSEQTAGAPKTGDSFSELEELITLADFSLGFESMHMLKSGGAGA